MGYSWVLNFVLGGGVAERDEVRVKQVRREREIFEEESICKK